MEDLFRDADGDGRAAGAPQSVCVGTDRTGWLSQKEEEDCDDTHRERWALMTVYADADGDGAGEDPPVQRCSGTASIPSGYYASATDCAPWDASRWRLRAYHFRDVDGDGATVAEEGQVCAGALLPRGYAETPSTEDCAPNDPWHWRLQPYHFRDADGDGVTVLEEGQVCSGLGLPAGYELTWRGNDCDDSNRLLKVSWSLFPDTDGDGVGAGSRDTLCAGDTRPTGYSDTGTDCAPDDRSLWQGLTYEYRDADGDGFTVAAGGSLCTGGVLPPGYSRFPHGTDCDDARPEVFQSLQAYVDEDEDGTGAGTPATFCTNGSAPAGYVLSDTDCAPADSSRWQVLTYAHVDADSDGHTTPSGGQMCTGEALPLPYFASASGNDCDDADDTRFYWRVLYPDRDGDGVGAPPRVVPCLGMEMPAGYSIFGFDPDDTDPRRREPADDSELELILAW
jgi:hypothetical protein